MRRQGTYMVPSIESFGRHDAWRPVLEGTLGLEDHVFGRLRALSIHDLRQSVAEAQFLMLI